MANDTEDLKDRIRDLEECLYQTDNDLWLMAVTFGLPLGMARLFGLMRGAPVVTADIADARIGMSTDLKVAIYRLRRYLNKHNIDICCQYGIGYWLSTEAKAEINRLIRAAKEASEGVSRDAEAPAPAAVTPAVTQEAADGTA